MKEENPAKIYGVVGFPVKHSLSPLMHNAAFCALKISAEYKLFEVDPKDLEDFLLNKKEIQDTESKSFSIKELAGFNITIPHKIRAKEILEEKFPLGTDSSALLESEYYVKSSGAINTVKIINNEPHYYNTDASGFLRSLKADLKFDTKGKEALVIGCGGAGRAIVAALSWRNVNINKLYINDINSEAMESAKKHFLKDIPQAPYLKEKLEFISREEIPQIINNCQLLVNASPVGMKKCDPSVINKNLLHKDLFVYDVVYIKGDEAQLIKDARSRGLGSTDGFSMLLYQGVDAFEIWTEEKAPIDVMRKALMEVANK